MYPFGIGIKGDPMCVSCRQSLLLLAWSAVSISVAQGDDYSILGPHPVGYRVLEAVRPSGTVCRFDVYYPAVLNGHRQQIDLESGPYPLVLFISPVVPMDFYSDSLTHLASWGFVVAAPTNGLYEWPDQQAICHDLFVCRDSLAEQNQQVTSPFFGVLDCDRYAFAGHSWGASCCIAAGAVADERLKLIVGWSIWPSSEPRPIDVVSQVTCPILLFNGTSDGLVPLGNVHDVYRQALCSRSFFSLKGARHFDYLDDKTTLLNNTSETTRATLITIRTYLTAAAQLYLRERDECWPLLWDPLFPTEPSVVREWESGINWRTSSPLVWGEPGDLIDVTLKLSNETCHPQAFALEADSNRWKTVIIPKTTDNIEPMGKTSIRVQIQLPEQPRRLLDTVRLSARSLADGHTRGVTRITTRLAQ